MSCFERDVPKGDRGKTLLLGLSKEVKTVNIRPIPTPLYGTLATWTRSQEIRRSQVGMRWKNSTWDIVLLWKVVNKWDDRGVVLDAVIR